MKDNKRNILIITKEGLKGEGGRDIQDKLRCATILNCTLRYAYGQQLVGWRYWIASKEGGNASSHTIGVTRIVLKSSYWIRKVSSQDLLPKFSRDV
jgi:hypothetical protein